MKEYKIVSAPGFQTLEEKVNEMLLDGWQLVGGVSFNSFDLPAINSHDYIWVQAMAR